MELGKLMFYTLNTNKYKTIKDYLRRLSWSHNFNTRKINVYRVPFAGVCTDHNAALLFASVAFWNGLPLNVTSCRKLYSFKKALKQHNYNYLTHLIR